MRGSIPSLPHTSSWRGAFSCLPIRVTGVTHRSLLHFTIATLGNLHKSRSSWLWSSRYLWWYVHPEDGGGKVLRNGDILTHHYTMSQPSRPGHEFSTPWQQPTSLIYVTFAPSDCNSDCARKQNTGQKRNKRRHSEAITRQEAAVVAMATRLWNCVTASLRESNDNRPGNRQLDVLHRRAI